MNPTELIIETVYKPVFFQKLAQEYGINPPTHAAREELYKMASLCRSAADAIEQEEAANPVNFLKQANAKLRQNLGLATDDGQATAMFEGQVEKAASSWANEADLVQACIAHQNAFAQELINAHQGG